jgi:O-antigen/teichoic acid export membrane protein
MGLRQNIARNTAIQTAGKVLGVGLSLVAAGMVFRLLGDAGFGKYTTIMGFLQIFGTLMDFGLYITLVKRMSDTHERSSPVVNTIFTMRVVSGVLFLGSAPLVALLINQFTPIYSSEIIYGMVLSLAFFFFISLNQLLSVVFQKQLQSGWIAVGEFIGKVVLLGATAFVVWLGWGLNAVLLTMVLSSGVNCLILFCASRQYMRLRLAWDRALVKDIFRDTWPIAISIVFVQLYFKGDIIFLSFFHTSEAAVGWYGAPYKILEVLITFPAMFVGLALPILTNAWKEKQLTRFQDLVQKSFDALVLIAVPLVGGTIALAPQIMQVLAGKDFANSTTVLRILVLATAIIFIGTLFGYLIVAVDKQRTMIWGYGFVAATAIAFYLLAIPRFSIIGAAWVTVYSELMVLVISMVVVLRTARIRLRAMTLMKSAAAALGMYAVLLGILNSVTTVLDGLVGNWSSSVQAGFHLAVLVPFGAAIYAVLLVLLRGIRISEIKDLLHLRAHV